MPCCKKIPEVIDVEIAQSATSLETLRSITKQLEANFTVTVEKCQELSQSIERVAVSFSDISRGSYPNCQQYTKEFLEDTKKINSVAVISKLQNDIKTRVKDVLSPLLAESQKTYNLYQSLMKAKKKYDVCNYKLSKTVKKYTASNKDLGQSKTYAKKKKQCDKACDEFTAKKKEFCASVQKFQNYIQKFLTTSLSGYAASTTAFTKNITLQLEKFVDKKLPLQENEEKQHEIENTRRLEDGKNSDTKKNSNNKTNNPLTVEEQYYQKNNKK